MVLFGKCHEAAQKQPGTRPHARPNYVISSVRGRPGAPARSSLQMRILRPQTRPKVAPGGSSRIRHLVKGTCFDPITDTVAFHALFVNGASKKESASCNPFAQWRQTDAICGAGRMS